MKQDKTITIRHVADHAGVSIGTVSRYLNGMPNVSPANATKVQEAVNELGYRPSSSARILAARRQGNTVRTGNIGIYFNRLSSAWSNNETTEAYINGVETACAEHNMHSLIEYSDNNNETPPRFIQDQKVDGFIITGIEPSKALLKKIPQRIPVVGMGALNHDTPIPLVSPDNYAAGRQVAQYLYEMGHRRIAFACPPTNNFMFLHRRQGIEELLALKKCLIPELIPQVNIEREAHIVEPEQMPPDTSKIIARFFARPKQQQPTAIIAPNDWIALGIYSALRALGLNPGVDVSVASFDNQRGMCCSANPPLTSYSIPVRQSAYVAAKLLIQYITSDMSAFPRTIQLITGELVERLSVKKLTIPGQTTWAE